MAPLSITCRRNLLNFILGRSRIFYRPISTSGKKKEATETCPPPEAIYKKVPDFSKPNENKNWVSYGYSKEDKYEDAIRFHIVAFSFITVVFCGAFFIYLYYPDAHRNDWARREAFIKLYEREQLGLEPISPDYIDPEKMVLPPDEEIGEDEIII